MTPFIVTGTDTGVGKTVVAAMLTLSLNGIYWKPIQAGTEDGTDTGRVKEMTGLGKERFRDEAYVFSKPLSPHLASEIDEVEIEEKKLSLPTDIPEDRRLIVEGAGGVLVPVTRTLLQADLFARWKAPVVLVARTQLGTINHSLLSIEALKKRGAPILGVVFVGDEMLDTEAVVPDLSGVKRLGRLPLLDKLDSDSLAEAFYVNFRRVNFETAEDA